LIELSIVEQKPNRIGRGKALPRLRRAKRTPVLKKKLTLEEKQCMLLQEFVSAREDSSHSILKKFDIHPKDEGELIHLKDGAFFYPFSDIQMMLVVFTNASETACGRRKRSHH